MSAIDVGNCIKTGARVLFEEYGFVFAADLYRVGNCIVIRTTRHRAYDQPTLLRATHVVTLGESSFGKEASGVFVVTEDQISATR